jgi:hypothetical protein
MNFLNNFQHLKKAKQTYFEHFVDSTYFSFLALKASFIFLIHGIYPDSFEFEGGLIIKDLHKTIEDKKSKINRVL